MKDFNEDSELDCEGQALGCGILLRAGTRGAVENGCLSVVSTHVVAVLTADIWILPRVHAKVRFANGLAVLYGHVRLSHPQRRD